ncbi:MAG: hypothetical protein WC292_01790 [Clostridia bacterium]
MKLGKVFTFLIGVIVGIVLVIGGTAGLGYYFITREGGVGKTADLAARYTGFDTSNIPKSVRNQSIYNYVGTVAGTVMDYKNKTIGEIESTMGINTISNLLYNQLGVPQNVTKASTFPNLGEAITQHMTVGNVADTFGMEFPDFPIFQNETFLATPINTAFSGLDTYSLDSFIYVTYDEDATEDAPASSALLQKLGKVEISEFSNDMDGIIDDLELSEIITEPGEGDLINKFLHLKVGELGTGLQETLDALALKEIMTIDETSPKVLFALQDCTLVTQYEEDGVTPKTQSLSDGLKVTPVSELIDTPEGSHIWTYLGDATLDDLGQKVEDMTVSDAIDTDASDCHILIKRLGHSKVSQIGLNLGGVIAETKLGEIITIDDETSEPILIALKDTYLTSSDLNASLAGLEVKNVFRNYSSGVLGLVAPNTPLAVLPAALASALSDSSIYRLSAVGVYTIDMSTSSPETKAYVYNQTPDQLVQSYIDIANDPSAALNMSPARIIYNSPVLNQEMLNLLKIEGLFESGTTLVISGETFIPQDTVFTDLFNIEAFGADVLTVGDNVVIDLGESGAGYMFFAGNTFGEIVTSAHEIAQTPTTSTSAVCVEYFLPLT